MRALCTIAFLVVTRASCHEPPPEQPVAASDQPSDDAGVDDAAAHGHAIHVAPSQIGARHILVMYRGSQHAPPDVVRTRDEAQAREQALLRRARAGEDIAALAREYSDEPGAATRGGDLGRFHHGEMVPAFERAAFALTVNQISDVVETPFGFHVIQRTE